jgi:ATP-dependent RNA helicase MSS116
MFIFSVSIPLALVTHSILRVRSLANAAIAQEIEDDLKPLPWAVPEKPRPANLIEPEIKQAKEMANDGPNYTFESLKRRVDHDTIKALTLRPFRFQNMSEVQYRVLSQMPEIAGIMARPPHGMTTQAWLESLPEGSEERRILQDKIENGVRKKDMLVKAMTGTGMTIVSRSTFFTPAR